MNRDGAGAAERTSDASTAAAVESDEECNLPQCGGREFPRLHWRELRRGKRGHQSDRLHPAPRDFSVKVRQTPLDVLEPAWSLLADLHELAVKKGGSAGRDAAAPACCRASRHFIVSSCAPTPSGRAAS